LILVPAAIVLIRTRYRYLNLILLTLVCFGFAILFRFLDPVMGPILPMGSHWLWHVGGAACTVILSEYYYRIETEPIAPLPWQLSIDERKAAEAAKMTE
jgi:hemolysin III